MTIDGQNPDMRFVNSPKTEAERVLGTLVVIMQGFYEKHGFVVMSQLDPAIISEISVVLPRLPYSSITGLWDKLKNCPSELPIKIDNDWIEKVTSLLEANYRSIDTKNIENKWKKIDKCFWDELDQIFDNCSQYFGEIEVRMTKFGTTASGPVMTGEKHQNMTYYLREDASIANLAAMIVNNILYLYKSELGITWSKREALMDFVMTRPGMKKIFPKYHPVVNHLSNVSEEMKNISNAYMLELQIPKKKEDFELKQGKIIVKGRVIHSELSKQEKKVLKIFVARPGELVTYDEIADILWGDDQFKTLWAINKIVGRMRPKLERLGIDRKRLKSIRGEGYLLK